MPSSSREKEVPGSRSVLRQALSWILWFVQDQWLLFGLAIALIIASQVQVAVDQQDIKQTVTEYLTVSIIFFVTGCNLDTRILLDNYTQWKQILFVQVNCFLVTSAIAFAFISAAASNPTFMDPWLLIGMILNASVATTIGSNVIMTRQANGNTALTVVQTTVGNFLSPFLSPLLIKMYLASDAWYTRVLPPSSTEFGGLYRRTLMQLGLSVFVPMFVGQVVHNLFPDLTHRVFVKWKVGKISTISMLVLIWQTFDHAFGAGAFSDVKPDNLIFIVFISVGLWMLFLVIAVAGSWPWMTRPDIISTAYCIPAKTAALGVPLASTFFSGLTNLEQAKIQVPVAIFQLLQIALGSLMTIPLRQWSLKEMGKASSHASMESPNQPSHGDEEEQQAAGQERKNTDDKHSDV